MFRIFQLRMSFYLILLKSQNNGRITLRRSEEPVVRLVPEQLVLNLLKLKGPLEPLGIELGLVEVEKSSNEECVVVDEASDRIGQLSHLAVLVVVDGPKETLGRLVVQVLPDESGCL